MSERRTDYESVMNRIATVGYDISVASDTLDIEDVLDICRALLNLVEDLNERNAPQ